MPLSAAAQIHQTQVKPFSKDYGGKARVSKILKLAGSDRRDPAARDSSRAEGITYRNITRYRPSGAETVGLNFKVRWGA